MEPGCRGRQLPLDPKLQHRGGKSFEGRTECLHSYDLTEVDTHRHPEWDSYNMIKKTDQTFLQTAPLLSSYAGVLSGHRCVDPSRSPGRSSCSAAPYSGPTCCSAPDCAGYEPEKPPKRFTHIYDFWHRKQAGEGPTKHLFFCNIFIMFLIGFKIAVIRQPHYIHCRYQTSINSWHLQCLWHCLFAWASRQLKHIVPTCLDGVVVQRRCW